MDAKYSAMLPWLPKVLSAQSMKRPLFVLPQCLANLTQRSLTFCWRASGASERQHKRGYTWRLFWHRLTQPFCQYLGHVSSDAKSLCSSLTSVWWFCVNFLGKRYSFSKDRLNWGKYEMLKIWWIWKIEIWSEELVDRYQTFPYQPGALIWGGQLSGSVSNPFNSINSLLIITWNFTPIHVYPRLHCLEMEFCFPEDKCFVTLPNL